MLTDWHNRTTKPFSEKFGILADAFDEVDKTLEYLKGKFLLPDLSSEHLYGTGVGSFV